MNLDVVLLGLEVALSPNVFGFCIIGVCVGMFVGVLPGIGTPAAVALLLPITYHLDFTAALVMLAGIYYGSAYGGSTAAILLNLPGHSAAAVTCLDGYPMAKQGRAGIALFISTIASLVGSIIGVVALVTLAPAFLQVAMSFGAPEYFSVALLGLVAAASFSAAGPAKALAMVALGLLLGTVGMDLYSGAPRYTFGMLELMDGVSLVALAMGFFGIPEVAARAGAKGDVTSSVNRVTWRSMIPTREDWKRSALPMLRGSAIGGFFGALPGAGGTVATFVSYAIEKKVSKTPEQFGSGAIEGVASPEAANNASVQTAFIPTLLLGIPGDVVMAILLGVFMIHGIVPSPSFVIDQPQIFWGLVMSFVVGNIILVILNIPLVGVWVRLLSVPYRLLYPSIAILVCIGVYSINGSAFHVFLVAFFGAVGYVLNVLKFEVAPVLLGLVLGPLIEENFRRSMLLSRGDFLIFVERPISGAVMAIVLALCGAMLWKAVRRS